MRSWNEDPFTKKARKENYLARSVYKLAEINQREDLLRSVTRILELGASPGSWSQYCLEKNTNVEIFAIDLSPLKIKSDRLHFFQMSIEDCDWQVILGSEKVDLVLSDMAPKTTGIAAIDLAQSVELTELALKAALSCLKEKGNFVAKVFMGDGFSEVEKKIRSHFITMRLLRPESTRKQSREIFLIGKGFKGEFQ